MNNKRAYYPRTTVQQRRVLFEVWEETGDRDEACRRAHVSVGTFYIWKPRFEAGGYAAIETPKSRAPKEHWQTAPEIEAKVEAMRRAHPKWGKRRITDEMAKDNNWAPLVSPNTVKRILQDAGLWSQSEGEAKKGGLKASSARRNRPAKP
jgi:transposase